MSETLDFNPDYYKNAAGRVVASHDIKNISNMQGAYQQIKEKQIAQIEETNNVTRKDAGVAYDVAWAIKPDIDAYDRADAYAKAYENSKDSLYHTEDVDSQRQARSYNLLKAGVDVDLERNAARAAQASKVLGQLAVRH